MDRKSRRAVLGFACLMFTLLSTGLLGTGLAIAVDTPTEPPPCGNTGLPCEPITPTPGTPAPGTYPKPPCGEGEPACIETPPGGNGKSPNPAPSSFPTTATKPNSGVTTPSG